LITLEAVEQKEALDIAKERFGGHHKIIVL